MKNFFTWFVYLILSKVLGGNTFLFLAWHIFYIFWKISISLFCGWNQYLERLSFDKHLNLTYFRKHNFVLYNKFTTNLVLNTVQTAARQYLYKGFLFFSQNMTILELQYIFKVVRRKRKMFRQPSTKYFETSSFWCLELKTSA